MKPRAWLTLSLAWLCWTRAKESRELFGAYHETAGIARGNSMIACTKVYDDCAADICREYEVDEKGSVIRTVRTVRPEEWGWK